MVYAMKMSRKDMLDRILALSSGRQPFLIDNFHLNKLLRNDLVILLIRCFFILTKWFVDEAHEKPEREMDLKRRFEQSMENLVDKCQRRNLCLDNSDDGISDDQLPCSPTSAK